MTNSASRETLDEIDALFERWHREVAEVMIQARRQAPVGLDDALRGASTAFTEARVAALRHQLTNETPLLNRSDLSRPRTGERRPPQTRGRGPLPRQMGGRNRTVLSGDEAQLVK